MANIKMLERFMQEITEQNVKEMSNNEKTN